MSYTLNVEPKSGYLQFTVTGDNTYDTVQGYLAEVHIKSLHYKYPNVLIVENLAGPELDTFSIYKLITENSPQALPVINKIAFVDINPAHDIRDMQFAEDVAVNRGLSFKVFPTIHTAEEWLRQQADPAS